jgi:uncharacterized protein (DUF1684 family)
MQNLEEFRREKDHFFANNTNSPLSGEQKARFEGLEYFPENPDLEFELKLEGFDDKHEITMQTSTGDVQVYQRYGRVRFEVEGQDAALTIYNNEHGYFLPFVDSQAGVDTYPAGRYLEPVPLVGGKIGINFNLAYNPFCAYNDMWSCPFPPAENRLEVPIRAGEKIFKKIRD